MNNGTNPFGGQNGGALRPAAPTAGAPAGALIDSRTLPFDAASTYSYNSSIADAQYQTVQPQSGISQNVIEFQIPASSTPNQMYSFAESFFNIIFARAYDPASTSYDSSWNHLAPHLLWSNIEILINGTKIDENCARSDLVAFYKTCLTKPRTISYTDASQLGEWTGLQAAAGEDLVDYVNLSPPVSNNLPLGVQRWPSVLLRDYYTTLTQAISSGNVALKYRPLQGMFYTDGFWPSTVSYTIRLTKDTQFPHAAVQELNGSILTPTLQSCELVLKRITLTNSAFSTYSTLSMQSPLSYPYLYGQFQSQFIAQGLTSTTVNLNGMYPRGSCLVLHLQTAKQFNSATRIGHGNPFETILSQSSTVNILPCAPVSSLSVTINGTKIPAYFNYSRSALGFGGAGSTSMIEYQQYRDMCFLYGTEKGLERGTYLSAEQLAQNFSCLFFVPLQASQEAIEGMRIVDPQASDLQVQITFLAPGPTVDCMLSACAISNQVIALDTKTGRVNLSWR